MGIKRRCRVIEVDPDLVLIEKSGAHEEVLYLDDGRCFLQETKEEVTFRGTFELWKKSGS